MVSTVSDGRERLSVITSDDSEGGLVSASDDSTTVVLDAAVTVRKLNIAESTIVSEEAAKD